MVDVILPLAIADVYTYRVPTEMDCPSVGMRVLVPLAKKQITGVVYRYHQGALPNSVTIRDLIDVLDDTPVVTTYQLQLWEWMAKYYMCTLGEILSAALPAGIIDDNYTALRMQYVRLNTHLHDEKSVQEVLDGLHRAKAQEKLLRAFLSLASDYSAEVERRTLLEKSGVGSATLRVMIDKHIFCEEERVVSRLRQYAGCLLPLHTLDSQQQKAYEAINRIWKTKQVVLLHGVTSSGKTEVYIHIIKEFLQQGKQILYLVPEIALTTQLTERMHAVFGERVVVYHSRFSSAERVEIYRQLLASDAQTSMGKLIIGARSAVLLPFSNLGLVIVDEEHEMSYKQQDPAPRYHARSVGIILSQQHNAKVLLGTATPSIESYHNAMEGKYGLVEMKDRFQGIQLPKITLIDLQRQYHRKEMYGHLADPVVFRMREELARGKQVIVFQNRRGYAPFLQCPTCGEVPKCGNCDVSMTYHKSRQILVCHSCGNSMYAPKSCSRCGSVWKLQGVGTERLEEEMHQLFPLARVARMDLDTTQRKDAYQEIIDCFAQHKLDILIGTQMVTKGLHFDDVSLVVVLQADTLVNRPDFRSTEYAYQMLEQVSGRAGRKGVQGEVMIQTFAPKNPIFSLVKMHDYSGLYRQQLSERQQYCFPPYCRLIVITLRHRDLSRLECAANMLREKLFVVFGERVSNKIIPLVERRNNLYVRQLRLRIEKGANIVRAKEMLRENMDAIFSRTDCKGTLATIDVDP